MINKFVTIIIPSYKDWKPLSLCLESLKGQSYFQKDFEIIVVNNDPSDETPFDYSVPKNCGVITEAKPGSYAARNTALKLAKGEIIGFTDADCVCDKDWIRNAVDYFNNNKSCSRIAGKVCMTFRSAKPTKAELYDKVFAFNQKRFVEKWGTGVTANLFTYKYVFDKAGTFAENLMSGGDFIWGVTAHKAGFRIDYVDNVIVKHPARYSFKELAKKEKRVGGGQAIFNERSKNSFFYFLVCLQQAWPAARDAKQIFNKRKDLSTVDKLIIYIIRQYLLIIRAYERFRVYQGKKSMRS